MAKRFNAPPNWPTPPEGWVPGPEWRPDPAWGPAPDGWEFWVDDNDAFRPLSPDVVADETMIATRKPSPDGRSVEFAVNPSDMGTSTVLPGRGKVGQTIFPESPNSSRFPSSVSFQQSSSYVYHGSPYGIQGTYGTISKKKFLSSPPGIALILFTVVALTISGILVIKSLNGDDPDPIASTKTPTSPVTPKKRDQSTKNDKPDPLPKGITFAGNSSRPTIQGDYKEYTGKGKGVINIEKPDGDGKPAYMTYDFVSDNKYEALSFYGRSKMKQSRLRVFAALRNEKELSGSVWLDLYPSDSNTDSISIYTEGSWRIRVYSMNSTPILANGSTISSNSSEVFYFQGNSTSATINFTEGSQTFPLIALGRPENSLGTTKVYLSTGEQSGNSTIGWPALDQRTLMEITTANANWTLNIQ